MRLTVKEAYRTLRPPLKFGDANQIEARKFLEQVELVKEAMRNCGTHEEMARYTETPNGQLARSMVYCECAEEFLGTKDRLTVCEEAAFALIREWRPKR